MNHIQRSGRRALLTLAMCAVALAGVLIGHVMVAAKDADDWTVPVVTIDQLLRAPGLYGGRVVALVAVAEGQRTGDRVAAFITRSDIHLHDETGSLLLVGGWQDWNRWRMDGCRPYAAGCLEIDAAGVWTIRQATVSYTDDGLPYLTLVR